jgi:hypothetical protein
MLLLKVFVVYFVIDSVRKLLDTPSYTFIMHAGIFLFTTASRTALGPTQPPIQWVPGALSLGVKRQDREADHSHPSSAEVKNAWSHIFTPQYVFMAWCLLKHRDNFTFTLFHIVCQPCAWRVVVWLELHVKQRLHCQLRPYTLRHVATTFTVGARATG